MILGIVFSYLRLQYPMSHITGNEDRKNHHRIQFLVGTVVRVTSMTLFEMSG